MFISGKKIALLLLFISFVFLIGFKDYGGRDDYSYRAYYEVENWQSLSVLKIMDPIFWIIRAFGRLCGFNYKWLFLCYAILSAMFLCKALSRLYQSSTNIRLFFSAFLFLVLPTSFTVLRQTLTMSMLLYYHTIPKDFRKRKIFLLACMSITHYGFVLLIPIEIFWLFYKKRISLFIRTICPILAMLLGQTDIITWAINLIVSITGRYSYTITRTKGLDSGSGVVRIVIILIYYSLIILDIINIKKRSSQYPEQDTIFDLFENNSRFASFTYLSLLLFSERIYSASRISYYYLMFMPIMIVSFIDSVPLKSSSRVVIKEVSIIILFFMYLIYMGGSMHGSLISWSYNLFS